MCGNLLLRLSGDQSTARLLRIGEIWLEAGILTGVLARIQQYSVSDRHRVLNDALLFSTARKHGLTVLTRNVRDFDLLQQLEASCSVLFYTRS